MDFWNLSYKTVIVTVNSEIDIDFLEKYKNWILIYDSNLSISIFLKSRDIILLVKHYLRHQKLNRRFQSIYIYIYI